MADKSLLDDPTKDPALVRFIKEEQDEIQKVDWPSRNDTRRLTIVVLSLTAVMAVVLGGLDLALTLLYAGLRGLFGT